MSSLMQQLIEAGILEEDFAELESPSPSPSPVTMKFNGWKPLYESNPSPSPEPELETEYYRTVKYHWLYSSPSYGWWHFSKDDNEKLEHSYRSGKNVVNLYICNNSYNIDFSKMTQIAGGGHGRPRHILRTTSLGNIVLKGVAGSRILKEDILRPDDVCCFNRASPSPNPSPSPSSNPSPSSSASANSDREPLIDTDTDIETLVRLRGYPYSTKEMLDDLVRAATYCTEIIRETESEVKLIKPLQIDWGMSHVLINYRSGQQQCYSFESIFMCTPLYSNMMDMLASKAYDSESNTKPIPRWFWTKYCDPGTYDTWAKYIKN